MHGPPSSNSPLVIYNQHQFSQFCWPPILQTPNTVQSHNGPPHAIIIPSNIPMPIKRKLDSCQQEQGTFANMNGPKTPLYEVPCPRFFQLPNHSNLCHPQHSFSLKHVQNAASTNDQVSSSTSKGVAAFMKNGLPYFPVKVGSEAASSTEVRAIDDLNDLPVGFPPDGGGQCGLTNSKEMIPSLVAGSSRKNESALYASRITGISTKSCQLLSVPLEKNQDSFESQIKKLLDATAATEARRKRKELTRMKNLHGRQYGQTAEL
uniref:BZIP transcription factor family protein n=1 Tax=Rhizophora mucronata TaxID=61149 RepID=A0A2P2MYT7_RHIMU